MKRPKQIKRYCKDCQEHTIQKVAQVKKSKASELGEGQRRYRRSNQGHKGFTRPKPSASRKIKKQNLSYLCRECKKKSHNHGIISKKLEFQ